jgi:hypothetical protein
VTAAKVNKKIAGSLYLIVIGFALAAVGCVFTWLLGSSYLRAQEMDQWVATECLILESEVRQQQLGPAVPIEYRFGILYGYEFEGERFSAETYDIRGNATVKERSKVADLVARFPAGSSRTCWVNPQKPDQAVLKKDSKAAGYSIWFPLLFVVGGIGMIVKAVWSILRGGN